MVRAEQPRPRHAPAAAATVTLRGIDFPPDLDQPDHRPESRSGLSGAGPFTPIQVTLTRTSATARAGRHAPTQRHRQHPPRLGAHAASDQSRRRWTLTPACAWQLSFDPTA